MIVEELSNLVLGLFKFCALDYLFIFQGCMRMASVSNVWIHKDLKPCASRCSRFLNQRSNISLSSLEYSFLSMHAADEMHLVWIKSEQKWNKALIKYQGGGVWKANVAFIIELIIIIMMMMIKASLKTMKAMCMAFIRYAGG